MNIERRTAILQDLADSIARRHLTTPARLVLYAAEPFGFLASQLALFARPLTPFGRWCEYLSALEDEEGWTVLQKLVDRS